jgi:hypothetical protein
MLHGLDDTSISFPTPKQVENTLNILGDLKPGKRTPDAAKNFPLVKETVSSVALMDCVGVNHGMKVRMVAEKHGIEVIPSAVYPNNTPNGSPPTSHDISILDGNLFLTFQHDISQAALMRKYKN